MNVYLPIAELSVSLFYLVGIGGAVGFLSGLFGVGGGFLLTPLLIFSGVPTNIAIASVTGQVIAASTSGALSHYRRGGVDLHLAGYLIAASIPGALCGVMLLSALQKSGQIDLVISIGYLILLGSVGVLMLQEAVRAIIKSRKGLVVRERLPAQHTWAHGLPFRVRFKKSRLYTSVLPVIAIGLFIGVVGAMLGIGGGFIMVPALVYILRVPGKVVIGTSLTQVLAMMSATLVMHAVQSQSVDIVLAFCLMVGGTIGAQFGASAGKRLRGEQLRGLMALLILAVAARFGASLIMPPGDLFSLVMATPL